MKVISAILILVVIGYVSSDQDEIISEAKPKAAFYAEYSPLRISGEYVVVFKENVKDNVVIEHMKALENQMKQSSNPGKNKILTQYNIDNNFRGYGALMTDDVREAVRSMDFVKYVEASQSYYAECFRQYNAPWGLARVAHRSLPVSDVYLSHSNSGYGVTVYILDTGIDTTHPDFGGRAIFGADFVESPSPMTDMNGHGTHVAGTVMSRTYGIAKNAKAVSVRVLDKSGIGSTVQTIAGINYAAAQGKGKRSVANLSFGGSHSFAMDDAIDATIKIGISFSVPSGNDAFDTYYVSPASNQNSVTVSATDMNDNFAPFSNFGFNVNILAPGVNIKSLGLNHGYSVKSGTSMAAAHVAGVMARILSEHTEVVPPSKVKSIVLSTATKNKIKGQLFKAPNLLVYKSCTV